MSGTMELDEFLETLESLGHKDFDRDVAKRLMAEHDRDESGSIDANEFGMIMLNEFCKTEMPKGELVVSATGEKWEIPTSGNCMIQLFYQSELPTMVTCMLITNYTTSSFATYHTDFLCYTLIIISLTSARTTASTTSSNQS